MESPYDIIISGVLTVVQLIALRKDKFVSTIEYEICIPWTHLDDMD